MCLLGFSSSVPSCVMMADGGNTVQFRKLKRLNEAFEAIVKTINALQAKIVELKEKEKTMIWVENYAALLKEKEDKEDFKKYQKQAEKDICAEHGAGFLQFERACPLYKLHTSGEMPLNKETVSIEDPSGDAEEEDDDGGKDGASS
ncbi:hypothetical protein VNO78_33221 [Psophocarpus tetragonolobus]|uniref:Uncharacterized protein n=1 Tax=Psophocarpus tetragonolobus TaxID=3891 RepID=A0AAN9RPJ3_PSOTE